MITLRITIILALLCTLLTGCALVKLQNENQMMQVATVIVGRVLARDLGSGPIVVAARSIGTEQVIVHHTVLHDSGEYELAVPQGEYHVFAYRDSNSNLVYDTGEAAGQHGTPKQVKAPAVGVVYDIDLIIPQGKKPIALPEGTTISSNKPPELLSRQAGDITTLADPRFAKENGKKGFWEPRTLFEEMGGNIYFLEEYDPEKIPILFIHGANGTPLDWEYFIRHIDRTRFQPWVFFYPSGLRINSMAHLLFWKLSNLQTKYQFNTIYFTAHSMGGLVARSFLVDFSPHFPYVKLFVSLATPWGGDQMAELGVKRSPVVIPSWRDMQPQSNFIQSLYRKKLPEQTRFYLFYGHRGNRNPFSTNNDGTIALTSLLDHRPQSEAWMNYAFNEDHVSILTSKEVFEQYASILDKFGTSEDALVRQAGGYLKVHFTYDFDFDGIRPRPFLVLRPAGREEGEIVTYLSEEDNGQVIGPFPPGHYLAGLFTLAAKTKPAAISLSVEEKKTHRLDYCFVPDGVIRGGVTTPIKPEDKVLGMPDYTYRESDRHIHIQSLHLVGEGVQRTIRQVKGRGVENHNCLIYRKDFCYNNWFGFFGLPEGNYTLTIKARGYKSHVKRYTIKPGLPTYFRITELTPE